jgi:regulation of enolase protein 1 (concanavalin A-like superfamily)
MIVGDRRSGFFKRVTRFAVFLAGAGLASAQVAIPPTTISAGAVNTNDLGFLVRTVGIDWPGAGGSAWMNSVANMEQALGPVTTNTGPNHLPSAGTAVDPTTGYYATNCANFLGGQNPNIAAMLAQQGVGITGCVVPADSNGFWILDAKNFAYPYINCDGNGPPSVGNGVFNYPQYPHNYFPGVPTCANPAQGNNWESIACSFMGYIWLPAGVTTLNVNSDDGFLLMLSPLPNPYDVRGLVALGEYDAGRGSATSTMMVNVTKAGWYTVRLDYEQGAGGIVCELFSTDSNGQNWLVNDTNSATALFAYPTPETFPLAYPFALSPTNGTLFLPSAPPQTIAATIQDGSQDQITNVIAVKVNGVAMANLKVTNTPSFTPNGQPLGRITSVTSSGPTTLNTGLTNSGTVIIEVDYQNAQGVTTNLTWNIVSSGSAGVYRELWSNLNSSMGDTLQILTNTLYNPNWPNLPNPAYTAILPRFQTATDTGMNWYGQRLRAYIVPPTTGAYTFWIASDDTSELFVSTDENPANKRLVAWVSSWTSAGDYAAEASQKSAPISLAAGKHYYVEALMQQGDGGDNLSAQWQLPNGTIESPIPATRMYLDLLPAIVAQPTNATVIEQSTASFTLTVGNFQPPAFQWRSGGANLAGATNATLTLTNVPLSASGTTFDCVVTNTLGSITSAPATLTVLRDTNPPILLQAFNVGLANVTIRYSKAVSPATATNRANYIISPALAISGATMADSQTVALTVSTLTLGTNYVVTVNGVQDLANSPNAIAPNSQVQFVASVFAPGTIGQPIPIGSASTVNNGIVLTAGGSIGGTADAAPFDYIVQSGNFDFSVRVQSLTLTSPWAKAGLMARVTLDPASTFAGVFATPSIAKCFFDSRTTVGASDSTSGAFPVNYPNTWLRLKRTGNTYSGYASFDGSNWVQLGSATLVGNPVYVGLVAASQNTNQTTAAQFMNFGTAVSSAVGTFNPPGEPIGPSSRNTQFVFSEIMYTPASRADGLNTEYVEIYNSNPWWDDLGGYQLGGQVQYTFPSPTIVPGGGYLVVAAAPADVAAAYGITNLIGPYTGSLRKGGRLELINAAQGILLDVTYTNTLPWPAGASKTGHSIVLANPTYGEADPRAWTISDLVGGSPGAPKAYRPSPLRSVMINEILANPSPSQAAYVELYNHSAVPVNVSGCILTDNPATNWCILPTNTVIAAGGFLVVPQSQLGFVPQLAGGLVLFWNPDKSRVLDAVTYDAQGYGVSSGRWPDGGDEFYPMLQATPDAPNGQIRIDDVAINEIMYKPISGNDADQYVELFNKGTNTVDLTGWQFVDGISFAIPFGTTIAPGAFVVVAANATNLFAKYPNLSSANTVGDFSGNLPHKGSRLALARPDYSVSMVGGVPTTNALLVVADEVTYKTGGRWGQWAHGGGSSLELINPNTNHRLAANWADSDETQKSVWTNLTFTGRLDNGANYGGGSIDLVQVGLLDVGEALVDNLVFQSGTTGPNLIQNPGFESGMQGWEAVGDHSTSGLETSVGLGGYQSAQSLHLRSSDGMWTGLNDVESALPANSLGSGATTTLSLTGRWLRGTPYVLLRVHGNWIELTGALPIPANLGTPGMGNSQATANPPPAIFHVKHSPAIPAANQSVQVTAKFHCAHGFQPKLLYRKDTQANPSPTYTTVQMNDNGLSGDALAGDGIYTATIPGQAAGTVVAFLVEAMDWTNLAQSVFPQVLNDNSGLPRECVVVFGDPVPVGTFGHWHLWLTQNWINNWINQSGLGNGGSDATLVDGGGRIIYDVGGRYAGSPYHQYTGSPVTTLGGMHWSAPDDDLMLGSHTLNKQHVPGNGPLDDNTIQREQTCYWMARQLGLKWNYRRYYIQYVNGNRHGPLVEDSQTPDGDMVNEYFPNDNNGFLYKNHAWFEFPPMPSLGQSLNFDNDGFCSLSKFTTTIGGVAGQFKLARYRWDWWVRQYPDSPNNYTNVYALINAANIAQSSPSYYQTMESLVDTDEWMRWSALEHASGDWDSFVTQNGWNMFSYKPLNGKWTLLKWDWNICMGSSGSWGPDGSNLFTIGDAVMNSFQTYAPYKRALLRGFLDIANGPMASANVGPVLDAKYTAFAANGLPAAYSVQEPGAAGLKDWLATMRISLFTAITNAGMASVPFAVNGATNLVTAQNYLTLTGTAPLEVRTITVNGEQFFVTWSTLKNWSVRVTLFGYTNRLVLQGINSLGQPVAGASAVVTVIDTSAPQDYTYIPYTQAGQIYTQDFNSLPNPGATTVNSGDPITINGLVYSLADPFAFGAPLAASGNGGLGLPFTLSGWYGLGALEAKLGASAGDQTTGGVISFGPTNSANSNRALGLLATSITGPTAFAAKFLNLSGLPLNVMSLSYTGELWRQNSDAKAISFGYYFDPTATNQFTANVTAWVTNLDLSFPTGPEGAQDGTSPANQIGLSVTNQPIGEWTPGAALWLVWLMADPTGKGQGLAIDNLSFSASQLPLLTAQPSASGVEVLWPLTFAGLILQQSSLLGQRADWTDMALPVSTNHGWYSVTVPVTNAAQFFRLKH